MKRLLLLALPIAAHAGVSYSDNSGLPSIDLPDQYTLSLSFGPITSSTLNGNNGIATSRSYSANINNGVVNLSMSASAQRDPGGPTATANATQSFSFTDTLFVQSSAPVTMTLTPLITISPSGGANTGWTSHVLFSLNSEASTFTISQSTEDRRTETSTLATASPITVTFDPSEETNDTGVFTLSYLNFFDENVFAQAKTPDSSNAASLNLQYSMLITEVIGDAVISSASGTNYSVAAVPEPSAFATLAGLAGLAFAGVGRRRRFES